MFEDRYDADGARVAKKMLEAHYPSAVISLLAESGTRIVPIGSTTYREASPVIRGMGINVDSWPVPPAGLFVVDERSVYISKITTMTVVHEVAHALDAALGGGCISKRSGLRDPRCVS